MSKIKVLIPIYNDWQSVWEGLITKDKLNSLSKYICIDNICVGNR